MVPAVLAQPAHAFGDFVLARYNHSSVAHCAPIFGRIGAEAADIADAAEPLAVIAAAASLGTVLYEEEPTFVRKAQNWVEVGSLAIEVHRDHCLAARRRDAIQSGRIERQVDLVDVDEYWRGANR